MGSRFFQLIWVYLPCTMYRWTIFKEYCHRLQKIHKTPLLNISAFFLCWDRRHLGIFLNLKAEVLKCLSLTVRIYGKWETQDEMYMYADLLIEMMPFLLSGVNIFSSFLVSPHIPLRILSFPANFQLRISFYKVYIS